MYARTAALRQYQNVGVQSEVFEASPHRLIQMLFEGGLSRIAQAKGAMQNQKYQLKGQLIAKATEILFGLRDMSKRLAEANRTNDERILDEVAQLLRNIKEGWDGIAPV